jgi:hypothetical protein
MQFFISHANADLEIAQALRMRLDELSPELSCFLLADDVFPGDDWEQRIRSAAGTCDAILCLATESYISRPWFAAEWAIFWFQEKPWFLCLLDVALGDVFEPMNRRQAVNLKDRRSVERLLESVVSDANFDETRALDLLADEIVKSVASAARRRDLSNAEAALAQFALSMKRGTTNVDPALVTKLLETGKRESVMAVATNTDNPVALRQLSAVLIDSGDFPGALQIVDRVSNFAERRTVGLYAEDALTREETNEQALALLFRVYRGVRDPQRRDLRAGAKDRGIHIEWPDVEPNP